MIRRGGGQRCSVVFGVFGNKVSQIYSTLHRVLIMARITAWVLASHTGNLASVAQGALELERWKIRWCHFLSGPCVFGYIF